MGLFSRAAAPLRGFQLLRRVLVELRGIRRALDRQADVLELAQAGEGRDRESLHAQTFRSYSHLKPDLTDREVREVTAVSYVDEATLGKMLRAEDELRAFLGRDPSETELERAYRGDVE